MKKLISGAVLLLCILVISGCKDSKEKAIMDFAVNFGEMVKEKDVQGIKDVYPDVGEIRSMYLNFDKNKIDIFPEGKGKYKIRYGNGAYILVRTGLNDAIEVTGSEGIFENGAPAVAKEETVKEIPAPAPTPKPAPTPAPVVSNSVFNNGSNVLNGSFNYQGAEYGFIISFNYNTSTGRVSNAVYKATGYGGGSTNKINSMVISGNESSISISGPGLSINVAGSPGSYSGSMTRGTHSGSCRIWN